MKEQNIKNKIKKNKLKKIFRKLIKKQDFFNKFLEKFKYYPLDAALKYYRSKNF